MSQFRPRPTAGTVAMGVEQRLSSGERLGRSRGVRGGEWCAREAEGRAIYRRAREAEAECRRSSSTKALASSASMGGHGKTTKH